MMFVKFLLRTVAVVAIGLLLLRFLMKRVIGDKLAKPGSHELAEIAALGERCRRALAICPT